MNTMIYKVKRKKRLDLNLRQLIEKLKDMAIIDLIRKHQMIIIKGKYIMILMNLLTLQSCHN